MLTQIFFSDRDIEPLLVFALAYLTFIMAELVHWSGILAIIGKKI